MKIKIIVLFVLTMFLGIGVANAAIMDKVVSDLKAGAAVQVEKGTANMQDAVMQNLQLAPSHTSTNPASCSSSGGMCSTLGGNACPGSSTVISNVTGCPTGAVCCTSTAPKAANSSDPGTFTMHATTSGSGNTFVNPLGNVNTVAGVLSNVLSNLKAVIATIAIVMIVVGGFMYILSAGDEKMITKAKATIGSALIGLAIALAAPTFLKEIVAILSTGDGASADAAVAAAPGIKEIATRVLNLLLSIVGIIAMIGLVIGGAFYLTAYGDEKKIETGKKIITNSIIGIAVAMIALVLVRQVAGLLGVQ